MLMRGFASDPMIRVIWDRRLGPRRCEQTSVDEDRRRADRRRNARPAWGGSDYLLLTLAEQATPQLAQSIDMEPLIAAAGMAPDVDCAIRFDLPLLLTGSDPALRLRLAEYIHDRSPRRRGPLVIFTACAEARGRAARCHVQIASQGATLTISETVADSLDMARFGTLFIPEIATATPEQQEDLVRFFTRRAAYRNEIGADARVITATGHELLTDVALQRFRSDLFYYVNPLHLSMPSSLG